MMKREKIDIEDLGFIEEHKYGHNKHTKDNIKKYLVERHDDFNFVAEESVYEDLEKGYRDLEIIIQRKSDLKYFKFTYCFTPQESYFDDTTATEVFKKQKLVDYYE